MNKPVLVLTVGLPRSGKSTWAMQQNVPVVNPDSIRLALHGQRFIATAEPFVWATAKLMVRSLFLAGHDMVILDATNTTAKRRAEWEDEMWTLGYRMFNAAPEECIARALAAGDTQIVPVIQRMAASLEAP